ncbi:MAG: L-alanine exporter AlaE [Nanoarchaeota archaeon]|nr:L-alanine exporter AlaE [Nanoarchaeota archaeon]MBU1322112.1 L-alanine exporter AlaE [Nanoarchaeota archaeon]MBU1597433.1 L-alanine exporter AlaE [Nanoarchaeota archaeon]MBU2441602.1 L-alanine exporter AlaE [Nanoarchaeota archaeon]
MKNNLELNNLEKIIGKFDCRSVLQGVQNYLIDTSAKVASYAPLMATMEAFNGLDGDQILQSRLSAALVDSVVARVYGKTLDYVRNKFHADPKEKSMKNYFIDTITMISIYTPVYAGILFATGANLSQIGSALLMGAGIATVTARPYAKYVLAPWRKLCKYKK